MSIKTVQIVTCDVCEKVIPEALLGTKDVVSLLRWPLAFHYHCLLNVNGTILGLVIEELRRGQEPLKWDGKQNV